MKFIEINGILINLDNITRINTDDNLIFYKNDLVSFLVHKNTPGYASLKVYLLNLCVARFDAESDSVLEVEQEQSSHENP